MPPSFIAISEKFSGYISCIDIAEIPHIFLNNKLAKLNTVDTHILNSIHGIYNHTRWHLSKHLKCIPVVTDALVCCVCSVLVVYIYIAYCMLTGCLLRIVFFLALCLNSALYHCATQEWSTPILILERTM